jgi:hypothetical protein
MTAFRNTTTPAAQLAIAVGDLNDDARIRRYAAMRALGAIVTQADAMDRLGARIAQ